MEKVPVTAELISFLDSLEPAALDAYAKVCGTSAAYLHQIKGGHRRAGIELARRMVAESGGNLSLHDVRPDVWGIGRIGASTDVASRV